MCAGYETNRVIEDVDLQVHAGEIVALLGRNGAGKTTTLLALAGQLPCSSGEVVFRGSPTRAPLHRRARQGLGLVTEERSVFVRLTVRQNLQLSGGRLEDALMLFPN